MSVVPLRRIGSVVAAVCVLHALLLTYGLSLRKSVDAEVPHAPAMSTRWVDAPLAQETAVTPATQLPDWRPARRVQRAGEVTAQPVAAPQITQAAPLPPEIAAPEPPLRADSVQRAARESARQKGLATRVDEQLGLSSVDAQTALREGIASGARGDCLKGGEGGYANAGMGLLALPLLVLDAASGRCK